MSVEAVETSPVLEFHTEAKGESSVAVVVVDTVKNISLVVNVIISNVLHWVGETHDKTLDLHTRAQAPVGAVAVIDWKSRLEVDVGCHDGMSGNLKAWVDDEVDISAVEVAVEVVVPISHVETSAQIEEMEEQVFSHENIQG